MDLPKGMKNLFDEIYKQYCPSSTIQIMVNILVDDGNYDINVSPDKREVFINNEPEVLDKLRVVLTEFFENI